MLLFKKYEVGAKLIVSVLLGLLVIGTLTFGVTQCDKRRNEAAQSRVGTGQAGAAQESGNDAIETVSNRSEADRASEDLTRDNARDIRGADGAGEKVNPAVDRAGRVAICKRASMADRPECAQFRETPR